MTFTLYHNPGQSVTIVLETHNSDGYRADGYLFPVVDRIILPNLNLADDYPQSMIQLDTGLYYYKFTLGTGATSFGTYIVDVTYTDPATDNTTTIAYQVVVTAVTGNFGFNSTA
jgi:hypothetical protein